MTNSQALRGESRTLAWWIKSSEHPSGSADRVSVVIDRPIGAHHPEDPTFVFELNYGYVPGTVAPDGEPLDAYVIDSVAPIAECEGEVIAIVRRRDDVEDKLVVRIGTGQWDRNEIEKRTEFQERWFDSFVEVRDRGDE